MTESTSDRSLDELLEDTFGMPECEVKRLCGERRLGRVALLLHRRGRVHAAALLLDVEALDWEKEHSVDWGSTDVAVLEVQPYLIERFTDERLEEICGAFRAVLERDGLGVGSVRVRDSLPEVSENWRAQLAKELGGSQVNNQARQVRLSPEHPREDNLHFTNEWEHCVYRALKAKQARLPAEDTIGIYPLPGAHLGERTLEPDFLITYRGRAGVIEVDGPHHTGAQRRSSDLSREKLFRSAGVAHVDRIDVRDTTTPADVERFVDIFLRRLLDHR